MSKQADLFPALVRVTGAAVKAMALSDPQWSLQEPRRELVFPVGEPAGNDDRRWRFTPEDLAAVAADFASRVEPAPVLYRHGEDPARGGMAAGWIDKVDLGPDGLYAYIRYSERALDEIKDGAWGYRSPGFDAEQDAEGYWRPRRLSEVSLVNDPAIAGMPPIKAKRTEPDAPAVEPVELPPAAPDGGTQDQEEDQSMGDSKTVTAAKKQSAAFDKPGILALLRETFAMPEAISDEMLAELLMKALEGAPEPDMEMEKKDEAKPDLPLDLPLPAAASVKPRIELVDDQADQKAEAEKRATVKAAVEAAMQAGKVTPANVDEAIAKAWSDPLAFAVEMLSAPAASPAPGQLVQASAADRSTQTDASRLTARYRNERASRPHFTNRSA